MVPANREPAVTAPSLLRLAAIGVLAISFALTACGRKGPLDAPPSASAQSQQRAQAEVVVDEYGNPLPPKGQKKSFFLDWLLN
jgi:predicted small lipoprotein YifL